MIPSLEMRVTDYARSPNSSKIRSFKLDLIGNKFFMFLIGDKAIRFDDFTSRIYVFLLPIKTTVVWIARICMPISMARLT
jgi:hypothetical protein